MSLRSTAFETVTILGCCLLAPFAQLARATPVPLPGPHHHDPATLGHRSVQLPTFQAGLWEYRRTVMKDDLPRPQASMLRKCADPTIEIREKMTQLGHKGCQFAPLAQRHGRYLSSWTCPTPLGPTRFHAVLIVRGAVRYTDLSEMRAGVHVARQRIEAARIGECSASESGGQLR